MNKSLIIIEAEEYDDGVKRTYPVQALVDLSDIVWIENRVSRLVASQYGYEPTQIRHTVITLKNDKVLYLKHETLEESIKYLAKQKETEIIKILSGISEIYNAFGERKEKIDKDDENNEDE